MRVRVFVALCVGRKLPDEGLREETDRIFERATQEELSGQPWSLIATATKKERKAAESVIALTKHTGLIAGGEVPVIDPSKVPLLQKIQAACPAFFPAKHAAVLLSWFRFSEVKLVNPAACESVGAVPTLSQAAESSTNSARSGNCDGCSSSSDGEADEDSSEESNEPAQLQPQQTKPQPQPQPEPLPELLPEPLPQSWAPSQQQQQHEEEEEEEEADPLPTPCKNSPSMLAGTTIALCHHMTQ